MERELADKDQELERLHRHRGFREAVREQGKDYHLVNDDYKALIQIMDRARKIAFLQGDSEIESRSRWTRTVISKETDKRKNAGAHNPRVLGHSR